MNCLRARLREITENGMPDTHPQLIEQLRPEYIHSIEALAAAVPIERYTCAMYALNLVDNEEYDRIVLASWASPKPVYASTRFVQRLIDREVFERLARPPAGALVVYRLGCSVTHIGRMISPERAESKWGTGHLYRHSLLEVPSHYGDELEFYGAVDADAALTELTHFARETT